MRGSLFAKTLVYTIFIHIEPYLTALQIADQMTPYFSSTRPHCNMGTSTDFFQHKQTGFQYDSFSPYYIPTAITKIPEVQGCSFVITASSESRFSIQILKLVNLSAANFFATVL